MIVKEWSQLIFRFLDLIINDIFPFLIGDFTNYYKLFKK